MDLIIIYTILVLLGTTIYYVFFYNNPDLGLRNANA